MTLVINRLAGTATLAGIAVPLADIEPLLPAEWAGEDMIALGADGLARGKPADAKWRMLDAAPETYTAIAAAAPVLVAHRAAATARLYAETRAFRFAVAGTDDEVEVASWSEKVRLAEAYLADPDNAPAVAVAALTSEATKRGLGETPAELAAKQVANGAVFRPLTAAIDGTRKAALAAIDEALSLDDIAAVLAGYGPSLAALLEA